MEYLENLEWLEWKSVKEALDAELVGFMSAEEKMKAIGKPVYAMMMRNMPVDYAAFYYAMCAEVYPSWVVESSMKYYERKFYTGLRKEFEERLNSYGSLVNVYWKDKRRVLDEEEREESEEGGTGD